MLEFTNTKVYDLKESVIACRNAMRTEPVEYTDEEFEASLERAKKLVKASNGSKNVKCHDNYLTGIRVSADMKYSQYITKQIQRYHWFDYVSSSSMMHRITKMDFSKCCNKYVMTSTIRTMQSLVHQYNYILEFKPTSWRFEDGHDENLVYGYENAIYHAFMLIISNCPMGAELFVRISTNYKQLQTMYHQRKHHKLKEDWGAFCEWVESLPYAKELIIGEEDA